MKYGKIEGTEFEKVEIGILSKYFKYHAEITENRDIISHCRDSAETLYSLIKKTDFSNLVEQGIVDKDSIDNYEKEVWKDLINILFNLTETYYSIWFADTPSANQNSEIYKDFKHLCYEELILHLVKEHKLEDNFEMQFGIKLKAFFDNRDVFTDT